jgi:hypothetical protein
LLVDAGETITGAGGCALCEVSGLFCCGVDGALGPPGVVGRPFFLSPGMEKPEELLLASSEPLDER